MSGFTNVSLSAFLPPRGFHSAAVLHVNKTRQESEAPAAEAEFPRRERLGCSLNPCLLRISAEAHV